MGKLIAFIVAVALLQITLARQPFYKIENFSQKPLHDVGEPLILTDYIEAGQIQEAKTASEVHLDAFQNVSSYSGYFNVDKENNTNLFFWFFPSANNYKDDPVVLWLQGGPGVTSLVALFAEHGPFVIVNGTVELRELSWHKKYSVLYIDQPAGTGFSFTDGDFVADQTQVGENLYSALTQFFTVFSELQNHEFFVTGESYGGKYVPAISYAIHTKNPTASLKINFQGLVIINGLSDPIHQFHYGDLLYQLGLIDRSALEEFHAQENYTVRQIEQGNYEEATAGWSEIVVGLFSKNTNLENIYNYIQDVDNTLDEWPRFVVQDEVRKALHVGNQLFESESNGVYTSLYADITRSVAPWVVELLNHYRVLIMNGQLDIIVGYVLTENYLEHLPFSAAAEYKTASRHYWSVGDRVAGYVKTAGNLTEVMVRNAGHMVPGDQPEFAFDLLTKFIANRPIA